MIGLRLIAHMPERLARLIIASTALPTGDPPMSPAFHNWRDNSRSVETFDAGRIEFGGTVSKLSGPEVAADTAPFPDARYPASTRHLPMLVTYSTNDPAAGPKRQAWDVLRTLQIPALTGFGVEDRIMAGIEKALQRALPGAKGQNPPVLQNAGHFSQEVVAPQLAQATLDLVAST